MADLAKIKVGDILRLDAEIVGIGSAFEVHLKGDHSSAVLFLNRPIIEAAEHIPAPKTFKRGDWVSHSLYGPHGLVYSTMGEPRIVQVHWPQEGSVSIRASELEPAEAPDA